MVVYLKDEKTLMYRIGIIGFGYWGPNIVRNFSNHRECEIKYICDKDGKARKRAAEQILLKS